MITASTFKRTLVLIPILLTLNGCSGLLGGSHSIRSSLLDYLYPDSRNHVERPEIPHLQLPLRVGIAYVPGVNGGTDGFSEVERKELTDRVAANFRQLPYVRSIETIPAAYLRHRGGFSNLDQLRQMFGIDVIVLLSYDQTVASHEGIASLTYWTIVGAYIVPAEKNDTQTLLDAAVYDIQSRKLLFRAPGASQVKSRSTLVGLAERQHQDSVRGFADAGDELIENLHVALNDFNVRIKEAPEEIKISQRPGYSGGGSMDMGLMLGLLSLLVIGRRRRVA